jgi:hypothetical protein
MNCAWTVKDDWGEGGWIILYLHSYFRIFPPCHVSTVFFLWRNSPSRPGPPQYPGFTITLKDTPQSVVLLGTSDRPVAETSTWKNTNSEETHQSPGGIRTRNHSNLQSAHPHLRPATSGIDIVFLHRHFSHSFVFPPLATVRCFLVRHRNWPILTPPHF